MDNKPKIQGYSAPFVGFCFFLSKPRLWFLPVLAMLFSWIVLFAIGVLVAYYAWPKTDVSWLYTSFKIFRALGLAAFAAVFVWIIFFPIFLNICFEKLLKKVYLAKGDTFEPLSSYKALVSGFIIFKKTILLRFFWILLCLVAAFIYGPLGMVASQIAIAHISFIDGLDLSLSLKGLDANARYALIKKYRVSLIVGGFIGGLVGFVFLPTLIVWLFWIPSLYIGACLFARERV
ncbi:hypothetical protein COB11_07350 [Candidatus Aerophobetes bacterium]|uniref:Uncharacterized protein n=2 Tax=Aerophobetes bacterium TaxID=2030807 RepID=A0A2A4YCN3_UNCAE|nr:MAG: hypothetical protein COB11_07350 [Candidatus Aerophobetes bacterium]